MPAALYLTVQIWTIEDAKNELVENWPAFTYILLTIVFSIFFFRQRRAETRLALRMNEELQQAMTERFERLEKIVAQRQFAEPEVQLAEPGRRVRVAVNS